MQNREKMLKDPAFTRERVGNPYFFREKIGRAGFLKFLLILMYALNLGLSTKKSPLKSTRERGVKSSDDESTNEVSDHEINKRNEGCTMLSNSLILDSEEFSPRSNGRVAPETSKTSPSTEVIEEINRAKYKPVVDLYDDSTDVDTEDEKKSKDFVTLSVNQKLSNSENYKNLPTQGFSPILEQVKSNENSKLKQSERELDELLGF